MILDVILRWTGWPLHRVWSRTFFRDLQRVLNTVEQHATETARADAPAPEVE